MITNDYIPTQDNAVKTWCGTLSNNAPTDGATAGMSPGDIADTQDACKAIIDAIDTNDNAHKSAKQAQKDKEATLQTNLATIRSIAQRVKKSTTYTRQVSGKRSALKAATAILIKIFTSPLLRRLLFPVTSPSGLPKKECLV